MAQEGGNVLNTGPVIPAQLGRRMAQIVGFEAAQPGPLGVLPKVCLKGYVTDIKQAVLGSQALQWAAIGLQGVKDGVKGGLGQFPAPGDPALGPDVVVNTPVPGEVPGLQPQNLLAA